MTESVLSADISVQLLREIISLIEVGMIDEILPIDDTVPVQVPDSWRRSGEVVANPQNSMLPDLSVTKSMKDGSTSPVKPPKLSSLISRMGSSGLPKVVPFAAHV